MLTILTIGGFDPSGGAGVLADIKTISAFACHGIAAVTSLTEQNTLGVLAAHHQPREIVRGQLEALFDDFEVAAIKTGMLPTVGIIEEVAGAISRSSSPVVVDPVLRSSSGYDLVDPDAVTQMVRLLFPLATVITPNAFEAARITGIGVEDRAAIEWAAEALQALGPPAVLITGGDLQSDQANDLLLDAGGAVWHSAERVRSAGTHGTGCAFASALACLLARGYSLREAVPIAKKYIADAIRTAPRLGRGQGPTNPFPSGIIATDGG